MVIHLVLRHVPVLTIPDSLRTNFKSDRNSPVVSDNLAGIVVSAFNASKNVGGQRRNIQIAIVDEEEDGGILIFGY